MLAASLAAVILWVACCVGVFTGMTWDSFWQRPESVMIGGMLAFWTPAVLRTAPAGFAAVHRLVGLMSILLPVLILGFSGDVSWLPQKSDTVEDLYQVLGFVLSSAAIALGVRRGWLEVTRAGAAGFVIFLFIKLFDWWWEWMPRYLFFLLLGAIALLILWLLRRARTLLQGRAA
jgi:uncharacterized membrane protein